MTVLRSESIFVLAMPFLLLPSMAFVFGQTACAFGRERGYLLGFLFYWTIWCLIVPLILLRKNGFISLFVEVTPLFSRPNWLAAVLFILITFVAMLMYGRDFLRAPMILILITIPAATINGICEELIWRGLYITAFPNDFWLAVLYPAIGFAMWHLVPLQIFPEGNKWTFVLSTFFLGLAYGFIAYKTGSAKWTAISHSLNGILALSGMLAPNILKLFSL